MNTPAEKTVILTFNSHPMKDLKMRWMMKLTFPAGATAETVLPMDFVDGENVPVESGTFEFAGRMIPVRDGTAGIVYADFIAGKHESAIWMHREGLPPVPGVLTFI